MNDERKMLRHYLATLAYRTQYALRGAPESFGTFQAGNRVRTPCELVRHMSGVLGLACSFIGGSRTRPEPLPDLAAETERFHAMLEELARLLATDAELKEAAVKLLLQGPLADAMTHAGQLAMLRRLSGSPVPRESFVKAAVDPANLGPDQPVGANPDAAGRKALR